MIKKILLLWLALLTRNQIIVAQGPPPGAMQTVNRMQQQQLMQRNLRELQTMQMAQLNQWMAQQSLSYEFTIVYADSTREQVYTKIDVTKGIHTLTLGKKKEKRQVSPRQTRYIFRVVNGQQLRGMAADSCWLFATTRGKINGYSCIAELNTESLVFIQKSDEGPLLAFTAENVEKLVAGHEKAQKAARRKRYFRAIQLYNQ